MTIKTKEKIPPLYPPGKLKKTIFLMEDIPAQYSFLLEKIDKNIYEFTIFTVDQNNKRTEYVTHCNKEALEWLHNEIRHVIS